MINSHAQLEADHLRLAEDAQRLAVQFQLVKPPTIQMRLEETRLARERERVLMPLFYMNKMRIHLETCIAVADSITPSGVIAPNLQQEAADTRNKCSVALEALVIETAFIQAISAF